METEPMTRADYDSQMAKLKQMEEVEMPAITQRIAEARAEGDLKENAEYHGARESQGMLQAKINQLKSVLAMADIVDMSKLPKDQVAFGCTVTVRDEMGMEEEFTLVGAASADPASGKIMIKSPLAQGLIGSKVGDKVEVEIPAGTETFEIMSITYPEM